MAQLLEAIRDYGPKLELTNTAHLNTIAAWMAMRTGLQRSEVMMMLQELSEVIVYYNAQGTPVKLPGIGTFTPSIDRHGAIKVNLRTDRSIKHELNANGVFSGIIHNKANINLTDAGFKALWDSDHPDDPLEI